MRTVSLLILILLSGTLSGCTTPGAEEDAGHAAPAGIRHVEPGTRAPSFSLTTIDDEPIALDDLQGKVVLLEFMGLGCSGCRRNLPDHIETWDRFGGDERFVFLAANAWNAWCGDEGCGGVGESEEDMRTYREEHGLGWTFAVAPKEMVDAYETTGTPAHFFIDHTGAIHATGNAISAGSLAAELEHLLQQAPAA